MDCVASSLALGYVGSAPRAHPAPRRHFVHLPPGDARRACLQRFIAEVYLRRYGARIVHFAQELIGFQDDAGHWLAAAGYTPAAANAPLFLEQYLDVPVEEAIAARTALPVERAQVVEAGNLAALGPGAARDMIAHLATVLHRMQLGWVVLTCTRMLLNSFLRLGLAPIPLAPANPQRLPDCGKSWGSYYQSNPVVVAADVSAGYFSLQPR